MIIDLAEAVVMPIFLEAIYGLHLAGLMDAESGNPKQQSLVGKVHLGLNI